MVMLVLIVAGTVRVIVLEFAKTAILLINTDTNANSNGNRKNCT